MINGVLALGTQADINNASLLDVYICDKCQKHEGQHIMNTQETLDGQDPIMYCNECKVEPDIADIGN